MLWEIWHPEYGIIYNALERMDVVYHEREQQSRDSEPSDRDVGYPSPQQSLPGLLGAMC